MRRFAILLCSAAVLAVFLPTGAAQGRPRTCAARGLPDPRAEVVSDGPTCKRAKEILGDFFAEAQKHGPPLTVDGFRCSSEGLIIECLRRQAIITYVGGP